MFASMKASFFIQALERTGCGQDMFASMKESFFT
jgi:hypothetical protein